MRVHQNMTAAGCFCVALAAAVTCGAGDVQAQEVTPGTVETHQIISVSMQVACTGKEMKRVVYAPPPGWHIRNHKVQCTKKSGLSSFTVNTLPAAWAWKVDEGTKESGNVKATATAAGHGLKLGAETAVETNKAHAERTHITASHHALVVEVVAQGGGILRGPGAIELSIIADLIYVGEDKSPPRRNNGTRNVRN